MSSAREGNPSYNPGNLLDTLQRVFSLKNDRQLATRPGMPPPLLCKISGAKLDAPPWFLTHLNKETNFIIRELCALMGDERPHCGAVFRPGLQQAQSYRR